MQDARLTPFLGKKAILFDVDGTLVNTNDMVAGGLADAFEHFTGTRPQREEMLALSGMPLHRQMNLYGLGEKDSAGVQARVDYAVECYKKYHHTNTIYEPTLNALFRSIDHGMKVALVTSRNRTECEELLTQFPVFQRVETIISSSDVAQGKPHPESAFLACSRLNIDPSEAFFVGDSIYDLHCAHQAGMPCLSVLYGSGTHESLDPLEPELLVETPEDTYALIIQILEASCEPERQPIPLPT